MDYSAAEFNAQMDYLRGLIANERERCIAICEGWIGRYQETEIQYTSPREYAIDAIDDIIDLIRDGTDPRTLPSFAKVRDAE